MNAAMRQIEADNNQQLAGVRSAVDYNSENALGTREHKNAILRDLLEDFEPLDLRPSAIEVKEGQVLSLIHIYYSIVVINTFLKRYVQKRLNCPKICITTPALSSIG